MNPRLREQFKFYERHGFHVKDVKQSAGSHFKVTFHEFDEVQMLSIHTGEPRSLKNNISRFKRLQQSIK